MAETFDASVAEYLLFASEFYFLNDITILCHVKIEKKVQWEANFRFLINM